MIPTTEGREAMKRKEAPGVVAITIRIPKSQHERVEDLAKRAGKSLKTHVPATEVYRTWISDRMQREDSSLLRRLKAEIPINRQDIKRVKEESKAPSPEELEKAQIIKELKDKVRRLEELGGTPDKETRQLLLNEC